MESVLVNLGPRSYPIRISGGSGLGAFAKDCLPKTKTVLVVADNNTKPHVQLLVEEFSRVGFKVFTTVVPAGETSKTPAMTGTLYDALADIPADRQTAVVALGGGVIGDLAGFAAATYNRGLPLFMVPTTLLAMVDSSVGGKVGVNHPKGKNLIGAFHQPRGVWIDSGYLQTLPQREYLSGLAEVVKYGMILDASFFEELETMTAALCQRDPFAVNAVVKKSCELKAFVVEKDEYEETGLRAVLNFGHTFAHAFEAVGGYGTWLHGEAVAAGMVCASKLAVNMGRVTADLTTRLIRILEKLELPIHPPQGQHTDQWIAAMKRDKKNTAAGIRFVLPTRLGHVELVDNVPEELVRKVLISL